VVVRHGDSNRDSQDRHEKYKGDIHMKLRWRAVFAAMLLACCGHALAAYPDKPISLVIPYSPGGTADALARVLAQSLEKHLGTPVIVENKAGASGIIGQSYVARAKPDGYTVLYDATPLTINPLLQKLAFDPQTDLTPVALVSKMPTVMVVSAKSRFTTEEAAVTYARENPGKVTFASGGNGTLQYMAGALFNQGKKIEMLHVPFKSGGPAITATLGAQVDIMFSNISSTLPLIDAKQLRPLAITSKVRHPLLPNVKTVSESGLPGFEVYEWNGVLVPGGTPSAVTQVLQNAIQQALKEPAVKERYTSLGAEVIGADGNAFRKYLDEESKKWSVVVQSASSK